MALIVQARALPRLNKQVHILEVPPSILEEADGKSRLILQEQGITICEHAHQTGETMHQARQTITPPGSHVVCCISILTDRGLWLHK